MIFLKLTIPAFVLFGSIFYTGLSTKYNGDSYSRPGNIKIGLLVDNKSSLAAIHGAELAISEANSRTGTNGLKYELVVRSMEGPWGTGSKQTVDLIFDEDVTAIAGSHGGRNAHLAEQVCAKSRVILVSARASDPTLSQAFVPWYFTCVPNDNQQADVLYEEIFISRKERDVLIVADNGYDARQASQSMINKIRSKGLKVPELIQYKEDENDFSKIATSVNSSGKRCIVVFGKQPSALNMLKEIRKLKSGLRIYASLSVLDEDQIPARDLSNYEGLTIVAPDLAGNSKWKEFSQIFHHKFGYTPGVIAAYSYDAVNIIIEAINLRGTDQTIMQETISEMESEGLTGPLSFDEHGNRKGPFGMIVIANGVPVRVK